VDILSWAIAVFVALESSNIVILYAQPGSRLGNGVGVFDAWERSKADPQVHALVRYLVNWVAGTKLIFVALLLVIVALGDRAVRLWAVGALVLSIASFYWRLFPAIVHMDHDGQVTPRGYSRTLGVMIATFLAGFGASLGVALLRG
jgi:hypothetical protein